MLVSLLLLSLGHSFIFFFFNDTVTTEIYTLSLHDALPILIPIDLGTGPFAEQHAVADLEVDRNQDRKSTRRNSSQSQSSYAVFCLKKKKTTIPSTAITTARSTGVEWTVRTSCS